MLYLRVYFCPFSLDCSVCCAGTRATLRLKFAERRKSPLPNSSKTLQETNLPGVRMFVWLHVKLNLLQGVQPPNQHLRKCSLHPVAIWSPLHRDVYFSPEKLQKGLINHCASSNTKPPSYLLLAAALLPSSRAGWTRPHIKAGNSKQMCQKPKWKWWNWRRLY